MREDDGPDRVVAGRYALRRLLGRGGMGSVWLANDSVLDREVAVKEVTFPVSLSDEERRSLRQRTLREARSAARFEHPRVTTVHDVVEEDGRPWIVMEHVPSLSLSEVVRARGTLPVVEVARIGLDVLSALAAAHRAGIVHRDVKPANVLIDEHGQAWLTDFGIATSTAEERLTMHGVLVGSPPYIAPERAQGDEPGPPADLWALGATLYTAVAGRPPFDRGEAMATLLAVTTEETPPLPGSGALEPVLQGLLTKDPSRRMTAEQARAALDGVLTAGGPSEALAPGQRNAGTDAARTSPMTQRVSSGTVPAPGGRDDDVQRIELGGLAAMAATATKAVAGTAVRQAARRMRRSAQPEMPPREPTPGETARSRGGRRRRERRERENTEARWRFKRRWVVVPVLLLLLLLTVALLGAAGLVLEVMFDTD